MSLKQEDFEEILQLTIAAVRPEQQRRAAQLNNREFIYRMLSELIEPPSCLTKEELLYNLLYPP